MHRRTAKITLPAVLRILAGGGVLLGLFPLYAFACFGFSGRFPARDALLGQGTFWLWGLLGALLSRQCAAVRPPVYRLLEALGELLSLGAALALFSGLLPPIRLCAAVLAATAFGAGGAFSHKPYGAILTDNVFLLLTGLYVAAVAGLGVLHLKYPAADYPLTLLIAAYLLELLLFGVLRNQSNIDFMMERRRHSLRHLPARIRYYNLFLMTIAFGVILAGFLLRDAVVRLLRGALTLLRWCLGQILQFLLFLGSLFTSDEVLQAPGASPQAPPDGGGAGGGSDLWFYILLLAAALFLLVRCRREILRFLAARLRALAALLRLLLRAVPALSTDAQESAYYHDEVETLPPSGRAVSAPGARVQARAWRRGYKEYLRMEAGAARYRQGYRLLLQWLRMKDAPPLTGDTPAEILFKTAALLPGGDYAQATAGYERVRYGARDPDESDAESLGRLLAQAARAL